MKRQQEAMNGFELKYQYTIPSFDLDSIRLPKLGPYADLGKASLETYSRVNIRLKSSQTFVAPSIRMQAKQNVFKSRSVA